MGVGALLPAIEHFATTLSNSGTETEAEKMERLGKADQAHGRAEQEKLNKYKERS